MSIRTSRASKRWMVAAAAAVACGSTLAISGAASAALDTPPIPERISGANRYETAVEVAKKMVTGGSDPCDFVIASGTDFPDGLASSIYKKPILLTEAAALPAATASYLGALVGTATVNGPCFGALNTTVVGGPAVVSSAQKEVLDSFGTSTRVSGANRYETAIAVAKATFPLSTTVIITTGLNFPDALAGGVLAQNSNAPILLNDGDTLRADVKKYLLDQGVVTNAYILGGTAAVPASVAAELTSAFGITVERLSGSNRAATAVAIANEINPAGPTGGNTIVDVNGFGFADALAAAPYAFQNVAAPILLTDVNSIPTATANYHKTFCNPIDFIKVVGGPSAVSNAVVAGAVAAATCTGDVIDKATLAKSDFSQGSFWVNGDSALIVKADAGTAADGSGVNGWSIEYVQSGSESKVEVLTSDSQCTGGCGGNLPKFRVTANLDGMAYSTFVTLWNGSPAAALTTASTTAPATTIGAVDGLVEGVAVNGTQDITIVVTFDRLVVDADPSGVALNLTGAPLILGAPDTKSTPPAAGSTTMTFVWQDSATFPPPGVPGFNTILFPIGSIEYPGTVFNTIAASEQLIAP